MTLAINLSMSINARIPVGGEGTIVSIDAIYLRVDWHYLERLKHGIYCVRFTSRVLDWRDEAKHE